MNDFKKAVLLISFGTSDINSLDKSIFALKKDIEKEFPSYHVFSAITSEKVRENLKTQGIPSVFSVSEALDYLKNNGYVHVICQPTFVIFGLEYDRIKEYLKNYENDFLSFKISTPLVNSENCMDFAKVLKKEVYIPEKAAYVFAGHGSIHKANSIYAELNSVFSLFPDISACVGTLESTPDFSDVLSYLEKNNLNKVYLIPLLTVYGAHSANDIFGKQNSWLTKLQNKGYNVISVKKGLAEFYEIRRIWINKLHSLAD